jgi:hypothetical protein
MIFSKMNFKVLPDHVEFYFQIDSNQFAPFAGIEKNLLDIMSQQLPVSLNFFEHKRLDFVWTSSRETNDVHDVLRFRRLSIAKSLRGGADDEKCITPDNNLQRGKGFSNDHTHTVNKYKCYANSILLALAETELFVNKQTEANENSLNTMDRLLRSTMLATIQHLISENKNEDCEEVRKKMHQSRDKLMETIREMNKNEFEEGKSASANDWLYTLIENMGAENKQIFLAEFVQSENCDKCKGHKKTPGETHYCGGEGSSGDPSFTFVVKPRKQQSKCWQADCKSNTRRSSIEYTRAPDVMIVDRTSTVDDYLGRVSLRPEWPVKEFSITIKEKKEKYLLSAILLFRGASRNSGHWTTVTHKQDDGESRWYYYDDDKITNGLLSKTSLKELKSKNLPAMSIYTKVVEETNQHTVTMCDEKILPEKVQTLPEELKQADRITNFQHKMSTLPSAFRSYILCLSMRDGAKIFNNDKPEYYKDAPFDAKLLKEAFPRSIGTHIGYRRGKQEIRLEFDCLQDITEAYCMCLRNARHKVWDNNIDFYYLPASAERGGMRNEEVPGRLIIEPIKAASQEEALQKVETLIRNAVLETLEAEEVQLHTLIQLPLYGKKQQGRVDYYTVFVTARSEHIAADIISKFSKCEDTRNIRVSGNNGLALCYRCKRRGHRDANCPAPAVVVRRDGGMINTKMKRELERITGCSTISNGKSLNPHMPLRSFSYLVFETAEKRDAACSAIEKHFEHGLFTSVAETDDADKCCRYCGTHDGVHLDSCVYTKRPDQRERPKNEEDASMRLYKSLRRQIDNEHKKSKMQEGVGSQTVSNLGRASKSDSEMREEDETKSYLQSTRPPDPMEHIVDHDDSDLQKIKATSEEPPQRSSRGQQYTQQKRKAHDISNTTKTGADCDEKNDSSNKDNRKCLKKLRVSEPEGIQLDRSPQRTHSLDKLFVKLTLDSSDETTTAPGSALSLTHDKPPVLMRDGSELNADTTKTHASPKDY